MDEGTKISLLKKLIYVRMVEERICELYPEQEMRCPVHLSIGQEACSVGACEHLLSSDYVFSNHRSHGHYLSKGGDLKKFFAEIYGKVTGCSKGRGGSMHLVDHSVNFMGSTPIVGGTIPLAVGAAFASSLKCLKNVAVAFIGDGGSEEGVFYESLNFAALKKLPVLFFLENNLYSVYTPLQERQPARKIATLAKAIGLDSYEVDGNNVVAVYELSKRVVEDVRNGRGPAFIEAATYRWREHCGSNYDNHIGYRTEAEFLEWKAKDPLLRLEREIISQKILTCDEIMQIRDEMKRKIDEAVTFAKTSPFPEIQDLDQFVYAK